MTDVFHYISPLGLIGKIVDRLFLEKYTSNFIKIRAKELKKIAEGATEV